MTIFRQRLSRSAITEKGRWMESDHGLDGPQPHHAPQVRRQVDRAVPCEEWPVEPPDRYSVEARVGEGHRLNDDRGDALALLGGTEQCALERAHAIAVSARAFRKQDQSSAVSQPLPNRVPLGNRAAHSAVDKHTALQL